MDINCDYNATFKSISLKLKKRFLRKPNVADAIEEYTALSRQLESEDCFGLSGYCMQQVAKSYHSVGNSILESSALQTAAKQYINSEILTSIETNSLSFNEDLLNAISLYEECIKLHCDQNERHLAAKLCLELADILAQKFEKHFESISYYERAILLFQSPNTVMANDQLGQQIIPPAANNSLQVILISLKLAALKVFTCDHMAALDIYTDICNSIVSKCLQPTMGTGQPVRPGPSSNKPNGQKNEPQQQQQPHQPASFLLTSNQQQTGYNKPIGIYSNLLVESDICKLLLLLYLKPTKMKAEHTNTLEVYSWFQALSQTTTNYLPITCMNRDLFILLQSFVMACQSNDVKLLYTLQTELCSHLNDVQNYILNLITNQLLHSSYTDDLLSQ
jgi:hypothetical protein